MASSVKITGLDETVAALKALPKELGSKGGGPVRHALHAAATVMRDEAIRLAPHGETGNLKRNIYLYRDRNPKASTGATERYLLGVRKGRGQYKATALNKKLGRVGGSFVGPRGNAYYWFYVEFGTVKMGGKPFLRPAFESKKNEVVGVFSEDLKKQVASAVAKARQST